MSTKDWKNKELTTILSEAWGFKFNTLEEFNEFNENGELQAEGEEELDELAGARQSRERRKPHQSAKYADEKDDDSTEKNAPAPPRVVNKGKKSVAEAEELDEDESGETIDESEAEEVNEEQEMFAPNHYCVHHGGVSRNGSYEMAEAIGHNFNEELGKVTHYDMKFEDGTIMEGVPFEDIQVTNASLKQEHGGHKTGKRDDDKEDLKEAIVKLLKRHLKG